MPGPARILTLNLGSQAVSIGDFRPQTGGGLVLRDYKRRDLAIESPGEPVRHAQITATIREMLNELGIKSAKVNYAVAGQSVFARFVKLPSVEEEKIDRIIAFEAQQNVPFPIDEVVWDYQLVGGGADEQLQVVLVAIKSDLLEGINAAVEAAGLRPMVIGVANMALYNAFRYNYSDVTDSSLVVDIGARTTNLLFIEPGKVFSRSVPIGGSSVTAALAKEFNEAFAAAETRKRESGFVSLGGAYADPSDADVARMSKIIRSTMTRLHAEIMRSISHYRTQQQGKAPARIYLCGGSSGMPYMRGFFRAIKKQVDAKVDTLRGFPTRIDGIRKDATAFDSVASPLLNAVNARSFWPQLLEDLNARLPKDNIWITELVPLSNGKPVLGGAAAPAGAVTNAAAPAATPITPARPVAGGAKSGGPAIDGLLIRGLYLWNARQQAVGVDYFKNLVGSPFFAIDPKNQQRVIKPTMPNNNEWAFPYELQLDLKQPLPLQ